MRRDLGHHKASLAMHCLNLLQIAFMVTLQLHYTVDLLTVRCTPAKGVAARHSLATYNHALLIFTYILLRACMEDYIRTHL